MATVRTQRSSTLRRSSLNRSRNGGRFWRRMAVLALVLLVLVAGYLFDLPNPRELKTTTPKTSAFIELRREEAAAANRPFKLKHVPVSLHRITPLLRESVMLSEDASFYEHDGFDFEEIEAAVKQAVDQGRMVRGASTISQQLVKNLYLSPSRNPLRKLAEAYLTHQMEDELSKDRILELYLNFAEWGDQVFGAEAAARKHFSTSAATLTPAQAVLLAAMLPMPLKVDPTSPNKWLKQRAQRLLAQLKQRGRIQEPEWIDAKNGLN